MPTSRYPCPAEYYLAEWAGFPCRLPTPKLCSRESPTQCILQTSILDPVPKSTPTPQRSREYRIEWRECIPSIPHSYSWSAFTHRIPPQSIRNVPKVSRSAYPKCFPQEFHHNGFKVRRLFSSPPSSSPCPNGCMLRPNSTQVIPQLSENPANCTFLGWVCWK